MSSTAQGGKQFETINETDYIILIIGSTGAGKSTFINKLCEQDVVEVGHTLNPCTTDLKPVEVPEAVVRNQLPLWKSLLPRTGAKLVVVDTPEFDGDSKTLKSMSDWLEKLVGVGAKFAGILYLHDINEARAPAVTKQNIEAFTKLCGEDACKCVVFGTTKWEKFNDPNERTIKKREGELQIFWEELVGKGSKMMRAYDPKTNSPWDLIETVLDKRESATFLIPIMGPSGAGKSTFVNKLCEWDAAEVGHMLNSCTTDLKPVQIPEATVRDHLPLWKFVSPRRGAKLVIVDTPGFDDTSADDSEILKRIAGWLANAYGAGARIKGVIYLQDINQRRVSGATQRNFEVFDKLCGKGACKSVVLGTTQWARVPKDERAMATESEKELMNTFWSGMIAKGSTMHRVDDEGTDPWNVVWAVLSKNESPTLLIQRELIELGRSLEQTEAAQILRAGIEDLIESLKSAGATKEELRALVKEVAALKERSKVARWFGNLKTVLKK